MSFTVHTTETAPAAARPLLGTAEKAFGFVPNVLGVLAESPAALEAYLSLSSILGKSGLKPGEQQAVLITVSIHNGCAYCTAAHSTVADGLGVPAEVVDALRAGGPVPDDRYEALRRYTAAVLETRGFLADGELERFLGAGFTRANALDVLVGIALKAISNHANHLADTPLVEPFQARGWEAGEVA